MSWLEHNLRGMQAAFSSFAPAAGAQLLRFEGLVGLVNPAVAERSVFNSVVYTDPAALAARYDEFAAAYADAGCAWTVWVPEGDEQTARLLERAGHSLDSQPRAMGREISDSQAPEAADMDLTSEGSVEEMAAINDAAYGYPAGTWIKGTGREQPELRVFIARLDGEPVATVSTLDAGSDCVIWNVATLEAARGRGLSTALLRKAIFEAALRGCETSTLQATKLGAPVYRRCGYQDFGALQMWESRPPELAAHAHPAPAA